MHRESVGAGKRHEESLVYSDERVEDEEERVQMHRRPRRDLFSPHDRA